MREDSFDVAVIGAGVVGGAIAWRLSKEDLRILWLESCHDVAEGTSKANSAIVASGYDTEPGSLEAKLLQLSNPRWEQICSDLDVPFRRVGTLVLAFEDQEVVELSRLHEQAHENAVGAEVLDADAIRHLAPAANPLAIAALHVPSEGIIDPIRLTIGYAQLAVSNGVELHLSTAVRGFEKNEDGSIERVNTNRGAFTARCVVNAAGLFADEVSRMAGADEFSIWPRKGQFLVVDREIGRRVNRILVPIPTPQTRGTLVIPTTNGSVLLGPTAEDEDDKLGKATDGSALRKVLERANRLVPGIGHEHVIKAFAGLRPASDRTYRVERSALVPNLIHAAAIRSTGVSSSPAVADRVRDLVEDVGLHPVPRADSATSIPTIPRLAEIAPEQAASIALRDPRFRVVVCACEHVTAAEIWSALSGPIPATSLDGIRKRTRAAGGRCQGAYCLGGLGFLLSLASGEPPWAVRQGEPGTTWGVDDS